MLNQAYTSRILEKKFLKIFLKCQYPYLLIMKNKQTNKALKIVSKGVTTARSSECMLGEILKDHLVQHSHFTENFKMTLMPVILSGLLQVNYLDSSIVWCPSTLLQESWKDNKATRYQAIV